MSRCDDLMMQTAELICTGLRVDLEEDWQQLTTLLNAWMSGDQPAYTAPPTLHAYICELCRLNIRDTWFHTSEHIESRLRDGDATLVLPIPSPEQMMAIIVDNPEEALAL